MIRKYEIPNDINKWTVDLTKSLIHLFGSVNGILINSSYS